MVDIVVSWLFFFPIKVAVKKREQSPSVNNSPNMEDKRVMTSAGPKFGKPFSHGIFIDSVTNFKVRIS